MRSFTVEKHGASLRFLEFPGTGLPLLMLHGLGCASSFEYPSIVRSGPLADRHVFLIDMFGFGYSDRPKNFGYGISDHAQAVAEFATAMELGRFDLYGHSMGGTVAINVSSIVGNQLASLILSEANLDPGGGQFSRAIAAAGEDAYVAHLHDETVAAAMRSGNDSWATTMRASYSRAVYFGARSLVEGGTQSWRDLLYTHPAKKSFIFGENSLPDPDFETLPKHDVETFVVSNAGHSMGLENPSGLAKCIALAAK